MIKNTHKIFIFLVSIVFIQNGLAQVNMPPVEDDKFFSALNQELEFLEADWMENYSSTRDIIIGASWVNQDDQENYLGQVIFTDKKLKRKLNNKGKLKDDIAVLLVVVTNNSKYRIIFDGSSATIINSKQNKFEKSAFEDVIKKFNYKVNRFGKVIAEVSTLGIASSKGYDEMRIGSIRSNLLNKSIKKTIVEPGESVSSLLFIPATAIDNKSAISVPIQNLKRIVYLDLKLDLPTETS